MKKTAAFLFYSVLFFLLNINVYAEVSGIEVPSAGSAILQAVLGLGLVVAVIYLLAWLLKHLNVNGLNQNKSITIVNAVSLGTREKAVLIEVRGQQMLLGVAPGRVSALHVFEKTAHVSAECEVRGDSLAEEIRESKSAETKSMVSVLAASSASEFSKKLNAFLGPGNKS